VGMTARHGGANRQGGDGRGDARRPAHTAQHARIEGRRGHVTERDNFLQRAQQQLADYRARVDELRSKAIRATSDLRLDYQTRIGELQSRIIALETGMEDMRQSGDSWEELRRCMENADSDLQATIFRLQN
jgi:hypothetical protein